jgi:phosphomannomutase/phosphoglucomutase
MSARMFGTAGIRGVTNVEITPELALKIATVYGDWMAETLGRRPQAGVGHDTRWGSDLLARSAAAGLASAGCHVQFYGCVSTGVYCMNVARTKLDGGILVTGSHMPPDRNGIIAMLGDGAYAPAEITDLLEERYRAWDRRARRVPAGELGRVEEAFHPYELYVSEVIKQVDARPIKPRAFRVCVDPANGTGSYVAKELFQWYGCDVHMLHYDPKPVPDRPSEPRAGTVEAAIRATVENRCDLGICLDVDADRSLFVTAEGRPLSEDTVGAIFAKATLRKGDVCVVPLNSSGLIELVCESIGARLEYCEIGQPATVKAVKAAGAAYSYEESGKYYFPREQTWCDGLYSGVKMLDILRRAGRTLSELAAEFPPFHQVKHTVHVDDARKDGIAREAARALETRLTEGRVRDLAIDGFKRSFRDHSWLLIRKSGTEPILRVYSDAPTKERAEELVREGTRIVEETMRRLA